MMQLSTEDWVEIWCALSSKAHQLRNGDFGESDGDCDVEGWAAHLESIMERIGEDGEHAVEGVAPVDGTPNRPAKRKKVKVR